MSNLSNIKQEWKSVKQGKVRSIYEPTNESEFGTPLIALVAGDGVSAFDKQLGVEIPGKGQILTKMSALWFQYFGERGIPTAFVTADDEELPEFFRQPAFKGRTTIMRKLKMLPVEAIVRGYITGSAWKAYTNGEREICGLRLQDGLENSQQFDYPLFTPTTKAPAGEHDENITFREMVSLLDEAGFKSQNTVANPATVVQSISLDLYKQASHYAISQGIILADTKFEFGIDQYGLIRVADELFTPDSSRFWNANNYKVGEEQASMDKQIIRNYIAEEKAAGREVTKISSEILDKTRDAYELCLRKLFP